MAQARPNTDAVAPSARKGRPSPERSAAITTTILRIAAERFLQDGFEGTSMEAVAIAAGIPKTTLYKRYVDKAALLRAVLADRVQNWSAIASQDNHRLTDDLAQRLRHYTGVMLCWATTGEVRAFMRLSGAIGAEAGRAGETHDPFGYAEMLDLLEQDIAHYGPQGASAVAAPRRVARVLMALISGWLALREGAAPILPAEAEAEARFLVDIVMRGQAAW